MTGKPLLRVVPIAILKQCSLSCLADGSGEPLWKGSSAGLQACQATSELLPVLPGDAASSPAIVQTSGLLLTIPGQGISSAPKHRSELAAGGVSQAGIHAASGMGMSASQLLPDDVLVVQTGFAFLLHSSYATGNPFNVDDGTSSLPSAPYRRVVAKLGKTSRFSIAAGVFLPF